MTPNIGQPLKIPLFFSVAKMQHFVAFLQQHFWGVLLVFQHV
jgi:hypothetical protein